MVKTGVRQKQPVVEMNFNAAITVIGAIRCSKKAYDGLFCFYQIAKLSLKITSNEHNLCRMHISE